MNSAIVSNTPSGIARGELAISAPKSLLEHVVVVEDEGVKERSELG